VEDGRLLLRSPWRRPFWLSTGLVRSVDDVHATLHIDSRVLDRYREPARQRGPVARQLQVARLPLMCGGLAGAILALIAIL
jgi:hypothetical protein